MLLEIIFLVLIVFAALMVSYKGAMAEFQILQKDWSPNIEWSPLLAEGFPLVIRNVSPDWMGNWTANATSRKAWPILVKGGETLLRSQFSEWVTSDAKQPPLENAEELAEVLRLPLTQWTDGGFRRWQWLPTSTVRSHVHILGPATEAHVWNCEKTTAACTLIQATDGLPLMVWLAHEGAVPASVAPELVGKNPWAIAEIPWMEEVKFVEVKLRPGNALAIPAHWWWAARPAMPPLTNGEERMMDGAWFWVAEFQTPVSWIASRPYAKKMIRAAD